MAAYPGWPRRIDLAVEVDGNEQMLVIIEIKGTDWNAISADRVMRNLCRHLRQLQAYLDTAIEDMEAGQWEASWAPCSTRAPRQGRDAGNDRGGRGQAGCAGYLV